MNTEMFTVSTERKTRVDAPDKRLQFYIPALNDAQLKLKERKMLRCVMTEWESMWKEKS
jgi:hypothetical protein